MKNILVTGSWFIGSHTCLLLLRGYNLYVIDSFYSSPKSLVKVLEINKSKKTNFQNRLKILKVTY